MSRSITETLDDLNIATMDFMEDVVSQINQDNVLSSRLLKKAKYADGGRKVAVPLLVAEESADFMDRMQQYNFQPKEVLDQAEYDWKHLHVDAAIDMVKLKVQIRGKEELLDLAEIKSQGMSNGMKKKFSEMLYTAVASLRSKDPDSLIKIVATKNNTVGGINAATGLTGSGTITLPFSWNPNVLDYSTTPGNISYSNLVDPDNQYCIAKLLRKVVGPLTIDNDKPTIILVTQGIFDAYEEYLHAQKQFDGKQMEVDGGFTGLSFRGIPLVVDNNVPGGSLNAVAANTGMILVLNEKYLGYRKTAIDFDWTPWKKLEQQPVFVTLLDWVGAFVCSRRDRQGAIKGLPTDATIYA